jgi:hypothetical protein
MMRSVLALGEQGIIGECLNIALPKTNIGESEGNLYDWESQREMLLSRIVSGHLTLERHVISIIQRFPPLSVQDTMTSDEIRI